jgi:hypothetical protein
MKYILEVTKVASFFSNEQKWRLGTMYRSFANLGTAWGISPTSSLQYAQEILLGRVHDILGTAPWLLIVYCIVDCGTSQAIDVFHHSKLRMPEPVRCIQPRHATTPCNHHISVSVDLLSNLTTARLIDVSLVLQKHLPVGHAMTSRSSSAPIQSTRPWPPSR